MEAELCEQYQRSFTKISQGLYHIYSFGSNKLIYGIRFLSSRLKRAFGDIYEIFLYATVTPDRQVLIG